MERADLGACDGGSGLLHLCASSARLQAQEVFAAGMDVLGLVIHIHEFTLGQDSWVIKGQADVGVDPDSAIPE